MFAVCVGISATAAFAHGDKPHDLDELWRAWSFDPLVVITLSISAAVYILGTRNLWLEAGVGHGINGWAAASFAAGWLSLVIALISPVHAWGEVLFAAHMTQHEILMLVSAPLCILGRPFIAAMWAIPRRGGQRLEPLSIPARSTGHGT